MNENYIQLPIHIDIVMDVWQKLRGKYNTIPEALQAALKEFLNPSYTKPEDKMFLAIAGDTLRPYEYIMLPDNTQAVRHEMFPTVVKWNGMDRERIRGIYLWQYTFRLGGRDVPMVVPAGTMIYCKLNENEHC